MSNEKGLTLVEVMISVSLIGILSVPIFLLLSINIKLNAESKNQIIATNLAENKIEELKFKRDIVLGEETSNKDGFTIKSITEIVERKDIVLEQEEKPPNDLYKLIVEVIKDEKIMEQLTTYRSSMEFRN